jgi:hypothetical protein
VNGAWSHTHITTTSTEVNKINNNVDLRISSNDIEIMKYEQNDDHYHDEQATSPRNMDEVNYEMKKEPQNDEEKDQSDNEDCPCHQWIGSEAGNVNHVMPSKSNRFADTQAQTVSKRQFVCLLQAS